MTEDTKSCFNEIIDNHYLDNNILKRCHPNCKQCFSSQINDTYMNCETCYSNYYLTEDTKSCYNEIIDNYYLDNDILKKCPSNNIIFCLEKLMEYFKQNFVNYKNKIDDGDDLQLKIMNISFSITSTGNQKKNENKNVTTINLGECENELKRLYGISKNDSIYIIKFDTYYDEIKIPKIDYNIYYQLYNSSLTHLNLSLCQNDNIDLLIPIEINDFLYKYNSSGDYYNNICSKTTSDFGTDISLNDRRNIFIDNKMTLCEENCVLTEYYYNLSKANCSCKIKTNVFKDGIKFDKKKLIKSFIKVNNFANINIIKSYKIVFTKANLIKNYGAFIFLFLIILFFICLFIFYGKDINSI